MDDLQMGPFYMSLVPVENFDNYWGTASKDPELGGVWRTAKDKNDAFGPDEWRVTDQDEHYEFESYIDQTGIYETDDVKSVKVGRYNFLLVKSKNKSDGYLCRYTISNGLLTIYGLTQLQTLSWLGKNYPRAENVGAGRTGTSETEFPVNYVVRIKSLDQNVLEILSKLPDNKNYWRTLTQFGKQHLHYEIYVNVPD